MEKLTKLFLFVCLFVVGVMISIVTLENGLLLSVLSFLLVFLFTKKVKIKNFPLFLFLFSLMTRIVAVLLVEIPIQSDYYIMYDAAISAIHGDFSFGTSFYFSNWGYQLGHVFYQALMLKIFNNVMFLKILNCVYSSVIVLFVYLLLKKVVSENSSRMMSLIYSISLYPIYLNMTLSNQPLSLMLTFIGIYFLFHKKYHWTHLLIAGLLIGLGNIERPEGIVYLLTIFIYYVFTLKDVKLILKNTAIVVVSALLITNLASFALIKSGVSEIGLKNTNSYWKFLLGFNYEYNGKNNPADDQYGDSLEKEKEVLFERITDVKRIPGLFYNKIQIQWLYSDLEFSFNANHASKISNKVMHVAINYIKVINVFILALAFIGILVHARRKNVEKSLLTNHSTDNLQHSIGLFFMINLLVYFGVYLLIEVNARYYYNPQIAVILLGGMGLEYVVNWYEKHCKQLYTKSR